MRIAVDTNVLVRYLVEGATPQGLSAKSAFDAAEHIFISTVVLCELVWVLRRTYRYPLGQITALLQALVTSDQVEVDRAPVEMGLRFLQRGGDFADGVIAYDAERSQADRLVTFDQHFSELLDSGHVMLLGTP